MPSAMQDFTIEAEPLLEVAAAGLWKTYVQDNGHMLAGL